MTSQRTWQGFHCWLLSQHSTKRRPCPPKSNTEKAKRSHGSLFFTALQNCSQARNKNSLNSPTLSKWPSQNAGQGEKRDFFWGDQGGFFSVSEGSWLSRAGIERGGASQDYSQPRKKKKSVFPSREKQEQLQMSPCPQDGASPSVTATNTNPSPL